MKYLRVRNWDRWQTFRSDRGPPPWIKLYRNLLHDREFISLSSSRRGELVSLWILCSNSNGIVPFDPSWIKQQTGLPRVPDLEFFIEQRFIEVLDAKPTSNGRQHDRTEVGEGRGRGDTEGKTPVDNSVSPSPPRKNGSGNGHDPRGFDTIKVHVLDLVTRLKTKDPEKLLKLGGRSCKLSPKQIRAALKQLHEDGRL